ncbi:MAG: hypothetical protein ABFC56_06735 [Clostridiaceae bacterium]
MREKRQTHEMTLRSAQNAKAKKHMNQVKKARRSHQIGGLFLEKKIWKNEFEAVEFVFLYDCFKGMIPSEESKA